MPINLHCNFEKKKSIANATKKIFLFLISILNIVYCVWYYNKLLKKQKKNKKKINK